MKTEAKNRLVMSKGAISVSRPSSSSEFYSWVWVIPLSNGKFRVAAIEIPKPLVDNEESFFEDDFSTLYIKIVDTIEEIDVAVTEAGANPDDLDAPWNNNFPL